VFGISHVESRADTSGPGRFSGPDEYGKAREVGYCCTAFREQCIWVFLTDVLKSIQFEEPL
jgi:hypothetical protein